MLNPHVEIDEESNGSLQSRYQKHCQAVNAGATGPMRAYHIAMARGIFIKMKERYSAGDMEAMPVGAVQHFMQMSNEQVKRLG